MLSRTTTLNLSDRASARRRQRRRGAHGDPSVGPRAAALYCATNGCASFLRLDAETGTATCPVCGFTRRVH